MLYRYEVNINGKWKGIFRNSIEQLAIERMTPIEDAYYWEMYKGLGCPHHLQFIKYPISTALFYFTKLGYDNFKKGVEAYIKSYTRLGFECRIVEIATIGDVYYTDKHQICMSMV